MIGLDAKIKQKTRREILNLLDTSTENKIVIICSCKTMGEGIDTKRANMCVFIDPKSSLVEITQNIGRVVRKQFGVDNKPSTVLIPYWLDNTSEEYIEYKKNIKPKIVKLETIIEEVIDEETQEPQEQEPYTPMIENVINYDNIRENIISKNKKYKGILEVVNKLIQGRDIVVNKTKDTQENKDQKKNKIRADEINEWKRYIVHVKDFITMMSATNQTEIEISEDEFKKTEREFTDNWMIINKQRVIKNCDLRISSFITRQNKHYIKKTKEMKHEEIYVLWTSFLEEYKEHLHLFDYKWNNKLLSLKKFIDCNTKMPSSRNTSSQVETQLGSWYLRQRLEYMKKIGGMKKEERYNQWTRFIQDSKYKL
jgi:hypothetical protein